MQIANISSLPLCFTDKAGEVVEILPGEAAAVDIDRDNVNVVARENAHLIRVGGTEKQAAKAARELSPVSAGGLPQADKPKPSE